MKATQEIIAKKRKQREENRLDALRADIGRARAWARQHFPGPDPDSILAPGFEIEFPDIDRMIVYPVFCGHRLDGGQAEYRLAWLPSGLFWLGDIAIRRALLGTREEISLRIPNHIDGEDKPR